MSIGEFYVAQKRRFQKFRAPKFRNVRSGCKCANLCLLLPLYIELKKITLHPMFLSLMNIFDLLWILNFEMFGREAMQNL